MKDLKMSLSSLIQIFMFLGVTMSFSVSSFAQNHNPEFEVSNLSVSGSSYIFIGEDNDEVMEPPRTEITLRYRDGGDAPEGGTTTLEWVTDGGADDGSTRVLAFDTENTVTGGFTDGDGNQSTTGPWYWTGGDAQESYPGNALYLQGVADTLDAEGNVTNSYSGNTVKLKASHSDPDNVPFDKDFTLLKVDIDVDGSDPETEKVDSVSGVSDALHFVTVARQGDVVLKADLPDSIKDQVSWETTAAGTTLTESASDKRIVSLSTEAENTRNGVQVPFKLKVGGTIVKEGNIWVVWADFTSDPNVGSIQEVFNDANDYKAEQGHLVTFKISPASLFSASERPDILGESSAPIPGAGDVHPLLGSSYSDGGLFRLDPSRSYSFSTSLPAGISIDDFNFNDSVTSPPASVAFPSNPMFGNDDTGGSDPDEPPSNQFVIAFDRPSVSIDNDKSPTDSNDNIINWNVTFEHFFRIDVGGVWYPASDRLQSEFDINLIYQAGRWGLLEEESSE